MNLKTGQLKLSSLRNRRKNTSKELNTFIITKLLYYKSITSLKNKNDRMEIYFVLLYLSPVKGDNLLLYLFISLVRKVQATFPYGPGWKIALWTPGGSFPLRGYISFKPHQTHK